jgi:hypothetical protein
MAKVTIGGLRRIIREEIEKVMEEMGSQLKKYYELHKSGDIEYHENFQDEDSGETFEEAIISRGPFNSDYQVIAYSEGGQVFLNDHEHGAIKAPGDDPHLWPSPNELDDLDDEDDWDHGYGSGEGMSSDSNHSEFDRQRLTTECPAAEAALDGMDNLGHEIDHNDTFWVIESKPRMISDGSGDGEYGREQWSGTNEPELASMLADGWDSISCNGKVYLCGTQDDEYGYYWNNGDQEWVSYNF